MYLTASLTAGGFHPAGWRVATAPAFPIARQFCDMAATAERGTLDAVWLGHGGTLLGLDPLPLLGSLIAGTRRIGLGAAWSVDHSEPFHVARVFATLDHLCGGRTAWLVGQSDPADLFRHAKAVADAAGRASEFIDIVRGLWDSWEDEAFALDVASGMFADPARVHPLHHAGEFFTVRGPLNVPRPVQGNPVLALIEDGTPVDGRTKPDVLLVSSTDVAQARRPDTRVLVNIMPILRDTADAARDAAAALDAMAAPPVAPRRFVGTPADFVALLAQADGCDGFNLMSAVLPDDLTFFVDHVVPLARAQGLIKQDYAGATLRDHLDLPRPRSRFAA